MYLIKQNEKLIAYTTEPIWTVLQKNGVNISTTQEKANGIVVNGIMYNLVGTAINGHDVVTVEQAENTIELARELKIFDISGKCSDAIERGLDIEDKHYSFSKLAQTDIAGCMQELRNGASVVPYRADGETDYSPYNLEQMTPVYTAMSEWIKVNTQYKATLKKWIAREESKDVLNSIDYGVMLPDDLLQELGIQLAVYDVDIKKYVSMLTQKQEVQNENKQRISRIL